MTEEEYLSRFREETPYLLAWGRFIISELDRSLVFKFGEESYTNWIKIPPRLRIKSEASLVAKAFILNRGWFADIYEDITDKVGIRYVVGLSDQILKISQLIRDSHYWAETNSKEFDDWRRTDPRIFDYQSAHFVLTSLDELEYDGITIPPGTKCEIQIRTLLQHAYAELSHDTLYKSNITNEPEVHRLFAKSMALMETTDDMLLKAHTSSLESISHLEKIKKIIQNANIKHLPQLDFSATPRETDYLIDKLKPLTNRNLEIDLIAFLKKFSTTISSKILERRGSNPLFKIEAITLVYFLAKRRPSSLPDHWPFETSYLEGIYSDIGVTPPWIKDN